MSYCNVDEAFNNSLKKQIEEYETDRINNKNDLIKSIENGNNTPLDYRKLNTTYFDTQGDLSATKGTRISDLKKTDIDNYSLGSLAESYFSDDSSLLDDSSSLLTLPTNLSSNESMNIKDRSHEYYIRIFLSSITGLGEHKLPKSSYKDAHEHVKTCKYCKDEIKLRLGGSDDNYNNVLGNDNVLESTNDSIIKMINDVDLKKMVIIIFIAILIIIILDFFVRINRYKN